MDNGELPLLRPLTTPNKRRKFNVPAEPTRPPAIEEEPHASPSRIGELGLHVLLSPKKLTDPRDENTQVARVLTFGEAMTPADEETKSKEAMEYWDRERESMYVTAFNTAVNTVLDREGHLFSPDEMDIINLYRNLPCNVLLACWADS